MSKHQPACCKAGLTCDCMCVQGGARHSMTSCDAGTALQALRLALGHAAAKLKKFGCRAQSPAVQEQDIRAAKPPRPARQALTLSKKRRPARLDVTSSAQHPVLILDLSAELPRLSHCLQAAFKSGFDARAAPWWQAARLMPCTPVSACFACTPLEHIPKFAWAECRQQAEHRAAKVRDHDLAEGPQLPGASARQHSHTQKQQAGSR